jgi:drug/metabolite transporter (DMT)-like permease
VVDGTGVRLSGSALAYTCWGFVACAITFLPIAAGVRKKAAGMHLKRAWIRGLLGGGCSLTAYSLALWAMTRAPIASVAALRETAILFGVLIAAVTLKERVTPMRAAACLFVLLGAIVLKIC